jgi:hypothetical protein
MQHHELYLNSIIMGPPNSALGWPRQETFINVFGKKLPTGFKEHLGQKRWSGRPSPKEV